MDASYAIKENIKLSIANYSSDGDSPFLNMFLTTFIFMFLNTWMTKLTDYVDIVKDKLCIIYSKIIKKFYYTYNEIILVGTKTISGNYYGSYLDYSDRFLAINDHIIKNIENIEGVSSLKEELIRKLSTYSYDNSEIHTLILNHNIYLPLSDKIEVKYEINKKETEDDKSKKSLQTSITTIFLRSTSLSLVELNKFIDDITEKFIKDIDLKSIENQYYFEFESIDEDGYCRFSETIFSSKKSFNSIFFEKKKEFLEKYQFFFNNKEWYDNLEISWHFGLLLYGSPGCGKTSIIKAMATQNKDHIISIPLSRVKTSKDLSKIFHTKKINRHKIPMEKRIYLFEDIDAMNFSLIRNKNNKENVEVLSLASDGNKLESKIDIQNDSLAKLIKQESNKITNLTTVIEEDPVTLSHFLNLIDGLLEMPGRRIIFTTNHRQNLDPALIREGRIDIEIETTHASKETINNMYKWFYKLDSLSNDIIDKLPENKLTPAKINNIFYRFNTEPEQAIKYITEL